MGSTDIMRSPSSCPVVTIEAIPGKRRNRIVLLLDALDEKGVTRCFVTLHVGAGTFQNLREEHIEENRLHAERVEVTQDCVDVVNESRAAGGRVIGRVAEGGGASVNSTLRKVRPLDRASVSKTSAT